MTEQQAEGPNVYSVHWVLKGNRTRGRRGDASANELQFALESHGDVRLRGAYSVAGLRPDADAILWVISNDLDAIQRAWTSMMSTEAGSEIEAVNSYLGVATPSKYVADHSPAFLRGVDPKKYLSVYPFVKTHEWYLLPFTERQRLMREHGEMGREFPNILTNTVSSFGLGDPEFIVAVEGDDPGEIMQMMQRLRAAEVRKYTSYDTPIYLGRRMDIEEVLRQLV